MAPALVLHNDAQDVWQRPDACEDADARAGPGVGKHRDGGRAGQKATRVVAIYPVGKGADRSTSGMSLLSRHQFCRWQKGRLDG